MHRWAIVWFFLSASLVSAQAPLGKASLTPDPALAGDLTRKKSTDAAVPALSSPRFEEQVELQIRERRLAQIAILKALLEQCGAATNQL